MAGAPRRVARRRLAGAPIRSAPAAKINANKSKEIQAKKLAFPWIPLAESGLFNGLQRIQIKKSRRPKYLQFVSAISPDDPRGPDAFGGPDQSAGQQQYSKHSDFRKEDVHPRPKGDGFLSGWRIPQGGGGGPAKPPPF
jgi:hypothetical protein